METKVVNLRFDKYDVYIGRAGNGKDGYFGNPFVLEKEGDRKEVLEKYKKYFYERLEKDAEFKRRVLELKGKILGCFCKKPDNKDILCHGDIIKEYLDNSTEVVVPKATNIINNKKSKVCITGSSNFNNKELIYNYLRNISKKVSYFITGQSKSGASKICTEFCQEEGFINTIYNIKWKDDNGNKINGAVFIRNRDMVIDSDVVVIFDTNSEGMKNIKQWAEKYNKKLVIKEVQPDKIKEEIESEF